MTPTLFAVCLSTVLPYTLELGGHVEHGTVAFRTPAHCWTAPEQPLPRYEYGPKPSAATAPAAKAEEVATTPAPRVKKATSKRAKGCKPGRWKDSRGVCRRKR